MKPAMVIQKAAEDGVDLNLTQAGRIKLTGEPLAVKRWLKFIQEQKKDIASLLEKANSELERLLLECARYYQCAPGEIVEMQEAAGRDPENALICFRAISRVIAEEEKNG